MAAIGVMFQFNKGAFGKHVIMEKAEIPWGEHSEGRSARKDKNGIRKAKVAWGRESQDISFF